MRQSYPSQEQYNEAIRLIAQSIEGEKADAMFYQWLIDNIPRDLTNSERQDIQTTIEGIRDDEKRHNQVLKSMYRQLTGNEAPIVEESFIPPNNFTQGIINALKGEMEAVKRYRTIMAGLPDNSYRDPVFNILTDEIRHGTLYNYVYTTVMAD